MIRSNVRTHAPVYREVLKYAFTVAWKGWRLWPLALLASILFTGSSYDFLAGSLSSASALSVRIGGSNTTASVIASAAKTMSQDASNIFNVTYALQALLVIAILILAVAAISVVAQGALVYALGAHHRGKRPFYSDALKIGGSAFWPVAAVNALAISVIWILRFIVAIPLMMAVQTPSNLTWLLYLATFVVFVPLAFLILIIQVFALNAMILQGAPAADAILRGYLLFKKHWVTVVETAVILFVVTALLLAVFGGIGFVLFVPVVGAVLTAAVLQSPAIFTAALGLGLGLFIIGLAVATAFLTQLHYATWTGLYRKLGEGGVVPKIHRWIRDLTQMFTVPQS